MQLLNEKQIECVAGGEGVWLGDWLCVCSSGMPHIVLTSEASSLCYSFCCDDHKEEGGSLNKIFYYSFTVKDIGGEAETFFCGNQ